MTKTTDALTENKYLDESLSTMMKLLNIGREHSNSIPRVEDGLSVVIHLLGYSLMEATHSMVLLAGLNKIGECFAIARLIFEHVINIGYFGAKGDEVIQKAVSHAKQKGFRDLDREIQIKNIKFGIKLVDIENYPISEDLRKSLEEFTKDNGSEIRQWTKDNINKRIEIISDRYGEDVGWVLLVNLISIYRYSSEILHGTLHGALFTVGSTHLNSTWPRNNEELNSYRKIEIHLLVQNVILLISFFLTFLQEHYPNDEFKARHKEVISAYKKYMDSKK